jgi:hypothetical protein
MLLAILAPLAETDAAAGPANGLDEEPDAASDATAPDASEAASGPCAGDMIEVSGSYCPDLEQRCLRWLAFETHGVERCAQFAPSGPCKVPTVKKHFCIDRYEYPNKLGERPVVMKSWTEAQEICRASGKRLCGDSEWTLACEGKHHLPYPYGKRRDARACNIDKSLPKVDQKAFADPSRSAAEVQRLWQGEASGSRPGCISPFGVLDMTGNVDEWVVNESGKPFRSGSKGGYWGPVRARCRPMTTAHGETFPFYQTGFRCCANVALGDRR